VAKQNAVIQLRCPSKAATQLPVLDVLTVFDILMGTTHGC